MKRKNKTDSILIPAINLQDLECLGFTTLGKPDSKHIWVKFPVDWSLYVRRVEDGMHYGYVYDELKRLRIEYMVGNSGGDWLDILCKYRIYAQQNGYSFVVLDSSDFLVCTEFLDNLSRGGNFLLKNHYKDIAYKSAGETALQDVKSWLNENYPDYKNPLAYWEVE
jgi:hypothetical protein